MLKFVIVATVGIACLSLQAEKIGNGIVEFEFADADKGFAIEEVKNCLTDSEYADADDKGSFWELDFGKVGGKLTSAAKCRDRKMTRNSDGGATFIWEGLDLADEKGVVTVKATVAFAADGTSRWSLDVDNRSAVNALCHTRFPMFSHVSRSKEADVLLPRTDTGAMLIKNRDWNGTDKRFGCMGYCPMMVAFLKDGGGLYFAAHDSSARIKTLDVSKEHNVSFSTPIENAGVVGKAAEGPRYEVTVAAFSGDWWEAASLYRKWALTTPWTAKGPIVKRSDYPRRLAEIPIWLNTHAFPDEVSNTMTRARAVFPKTDTGIHWHVWQHSKHDINYPEYFPEQDGAADCFAYCNSIGAEAMPYTNGRLWSTNLVSYPYVLPYVMKKADGSPYVEQYGKITPPMSPMCPYTPQWDMTLNDFSRRVLGLGAKSLFLDQIGACSGQACYDPRHGHTIGGGSWYYEAYQRILKKTHEMYFSNGAFLTTEGSGEEWMNVIDGYLCVTTRQPNDVPFFHAVYNGYTTYFCSPENQDDDIVSFRAAQTRELLWGQALGWYHPLIMDHADKCELLNRLAAFRQQNLDFLAYGFLLGEVKFLDTVPSVKLSWLGRKPFWAWKYENYPLSKTIEGTMPGLIGYHWKSGVDGSECAYIANLTEGDQTARFVFADKERQLTLKPGEIAVVR